MKVKGAANPYDPQWEVYFEKRLGVEGAHQLRGRRQLLYLWQQQDGLCPVCHQNITRLTGWHNHHSWSRSASGTVPNTALSQRLMNSEATDQTRGLRPAARLRSIPRKYASAAARYCSRENRSVTLIGTPAKMASSMAGMPCGVPGILMKKLGRPASAYSR